MGDAGLELRELRTFFAVYEELHFGRAAERLGVTPSRVSQVVRLLETRAGGPLLLRTSRRVQPTALGRQLYERAAGPCQALDAAFAAVRSSAAGPGGSLRLGMYSPVAGGPNLVDIVKRFEQRHPGCEVILVDTGFQRDQLDWLRAGDVDLLAMRLPLRSPEVTVGPVLSREERVLAVAVDHPLAGRPAVGVEDLAGYVVPDAATLPRAMMRDFVPEATPSGRPIRRVEVRTLAESVARVALGEAVHPTVASFSQHVRHPRITTVPIADLPPSETALVWLTAAESAAIRAFVAVAASP